MSRCWTILLLLLAPLSGCAQFNLKQIWGHRAPVADEKHPVVDILCIWQPGEGPGLNNLPTRGFAGQVMFFISGSKEPAVAEGDVVVYVFDQLGEDPSKPIHQFEFQGEAWQQYRHDSNLGTSYQVFIPYTRLGVHEAECTLRVRFTPKSGTAIYSRMATINLPGKKVIDKSDHHHEPAASEAASNRLAQLRSQAGMQARHASVGTDDRPRAQTTGTPRRDSQLQQASYETAEANGDERNTPAPRMNNELDRTPRATLRPTESMRFKRQPAVDLTRLKSAAVNADVE